MYSLLVGSSSNAYLITIIFITIIIITIIITIINIAPRSTTPSSTWWWSCKMLLQCETIESLARTTSHPRATTPSSKSCGQHTARASSPLIADAAVGPGLPLRLLWDPSSSSSFDSMASMARWCRTGHHCLKASSSEGREVCSRRHVAEFIIVWELCVKLRDSLSTGRRAVNHTYIHTVPVYEDNNNNLIHSYEYYTCLQ